MLMLPLPFFFTFALGLFLLRETARAEDLSPARQGFLWLIGACALHALLIGLYWGYGITAMRVLLPISASLLPLLAWGSFRSLSLPPMPLNLPQIAPRLLPTLAILLAQAVWPEAIDLILILVFLGYGVALWRMSGAGPDALTATALQKSAGLARAMRFAAVALWSNVLVDLAILGDYILAKGAHVPGLLSIFSAAVLFALGGLAVLGSEATAETALDPEAEPASAAETEVDHAATARRVDGFLQESRLYTQPDLTLGRIARRLALPARDVSTAINRHYGMNVSQYVNGFRLNEACRLLAETELSVTEVHLEAGFQTKSNFNREFRRQYGQSPTEWRALRPSQMAAKRG